MSISIAGNAHAHHRVERQARAAEEHSVPDMSMLAPPAPTGTTSTSPDAGSGGPGATTSSLLAVLSQLQTAGTTTSSDDGSSDVPPPPPPTPLPAAGPVSGITSEPTRVGGPVNRTGPENFGPASNQPTPWGGAMPAGGSTTTSSTTTTSSPPDATADIRQLLVSMGG